MDGPVGIVSGRRFDSATLAQTQFAVSARFVEKDALIGNIS
jgi:hypothetical protein